MSRRGPFAVLAGLAVACALAFLTVPIVAVFTDTGPARLMASLGEPAARDALWLSVRTTAFAMAVILLVGTPAAWLLATRRFRGRALVVTLVELPLVLPPAVAGIALLAAIGPSGALGGPLRGAGVELTLQTAGVVVALVFVASPFYVRQALAGFGSIDPVVLDAARTLGAGEGRTFLRVAVPTAMPALAAGAALALGRALGEFGATLMFAGSLQRVTQTAPLAIYDRFASDFDAALALSAVLIIVSGGLLAGVKLVAGREVLGAAAR